MSPSMSLSLRGEWRGGADSDEQAGVGAGIGSGASPVGVDRPWRVASQAWSDAYVYLKHDEGEGSGPPAVEAFMKNATD